MKSGAIERYPVYSHSLRSLSNQLADRNRSVLISRCLEALSKFLRDRGRSSENVGAVRRYELRINMSRRAMDA
jgi:hypothetical protein